jgi:hypothetical protein
MYSSMRKRLSNTEEEAEAVRLLEEVVEPIRCIGRLFQEVDAASDNRGFMEANRVLQQIMAAQYYT